MRLGTPDIDKKRKGLNLGSFQYLEMACMRSGEGGKGLPSWHSW